MRNSFTKQLIRYVILKIVRDTRDDPNYISRADTIWRNNYNLQIIFNYAQY